MLCSLEEEFPAVWAYEISICIFCKVYSTVRIFMVFFVCRFFFVHGKFHVFFHAVFFTIKIIIVRTVSGISNRIFRIVTVCKIEFFHQRHKAFHIGCIWFYIDYGYVFITDGCLEVVCRKQLIVSHVITF